MRQLNGMGAVFRAIPSHGADARRTRACPTAVRKLCAINSGLILVTGKTGSGKSTTLAAMIDDINTRMKGHILTIEDPIEFVHQRKQLPDQPARDRRACASSFAAALHSALREDPDVMLVGEMRDLETMSIAVTAAEMGILVMGTLHTNGAAPTVDRMVNAFPGRQAAARAHHAVDLACAAWSPSSCCRRADGSGRVAALEILINTPAVRQPDPAGQDRPAGKCHAERGASGMRTMDTAIKQLLDRGRSPAPRPSRRPSTRAGSSSFATHPESQRRPRRRSRSGRATHRRVRSWHNLA